jgi:PAS domain S-box-containing protein
MNVGFALVLAVLIGVSGLSYKSLVFVAKRGHYRQTVGAINAVLDTVQDAETGQRGYLLTGNDRYLSDYNGAQAFSKKRLEDLKAELRDNPEQLKKLNVLTPLFLEKMAELKQTVELRKLKGLKEALKVVNSDFGKDQMDKIRALVSEMLREQDRLLQISRDEKDSTTNQGIVAILFGSAFAFLMVALCALVINRDLKRRREIEEERDRFFTTSLDMLCIAGMDGYFKRLNPAFEEVLGFSPKELCSRPIMEFVHPDDVARTQQEIEKQLGGQKVMAFENRYLCKDGSFKWLSWKSVPVGDVMYAAARDVTERKRKNLELETARESALAAVRAKGMFLANMSHEIRTPLNGIIGMTDLLLETSLNETQVKYARIVQNSGQGLLAIINDILDFSKIEAGKMKLEVIGFNPGATVEGQADLLTSQALEKGLALMTYVDPKVPTLLRGDPGRISQILLNLVSNAIKFTEKGTVVLRVKPVIESSDVITLRFSVQDTGIGLSPEGQSRLFQPFTQGDASTARQYGGTGLGLSICKYLVELMGGQIGVDSEFGRGSTFWFSVPLAVESSTPIKRSFLKLKDLKVLIVDDDPPAGEIMTSYLESWNAKVSIVKNGTDALSLLEREANAQRPFDVAIIDMRMPGMDGFTLADKIRTDRLLVDTRLILATAFDRASQAELALKSGFSAYLTKPIKQSELYDSIVDALHKGQSPLSTAHSVPSEKNVLNLKSGVVRILVAEDNSVNQLLVLAQLKSLGYSANAVANGREAVEAVSTVPYDLVLMDCQMPEMDGFTATQAIRKLEQSTGRHITIIALTANAMKEDQERCLQSGMDDYMSKPLRKDTLGKVLDRWLSGEFKAVV